TSPTTPSTTAPSTSAAPGPSVSSPDGGGPLAGEKLDIFPYAGARLAVVGIAADDTLNVRAAPGVDAPVRVDLPPLAMNATATGHNRSLGPAGLWSEITADGRTGWANTRFLLQPGKTDDITAAMFPRPADRPSAPSMEEL